MALQDGTRVLNQKFYDNRYLKRSTNSSGASLTISENYVPKADSSGNLVDSDIYDDGTSIGIGTTAPLSNVGTAAGDISGTGLHIKGAAQARLIIEGTSATIIQCDSNGAVNDKMMNTFTDVGITAYRSLNDDATVRVDDILAMDMGTGNVGVGTRVPGNALHIYRNDASNAGAADGSLLIIEQDGAGDAGLQYELTGNQVISTSLSDSGGGGYTYTFQDITGTTTPYTIGLGANPREFIINPGADSYNLVVTSDASNEILSSNVVVGKMISGGGWVSNTTRVTSGPYAVLATDEILFIDTDGGAITVNLPSGLSGTHYKVVNCGSSGNNVTLAPDGAQLLNGSNSSITIADGLKVDLHYEASEGWW